MANPHWGLTLEPAGYHRYRDLLSLWVRGIFCNRGAYELKSDVLTTGLERAAPRSLFKAMGFTDEEMRRPLIGVANSWNEIVPGHIELDKIAEAVKPECASPAGPRWSSA